MIVMEKSFFITINIMKKTKGLESRIIKQNSAYHFINKMKLSKFQFFKRKKNAKMFRCISSFISII